MNRFRGQIEQIRVSGHLSQVTVLLPGGTPLQAIVIDTPETAPYLAGQSQVGIHFKETEVLLALADGALTSVENRMKGRVEYLEAGELLTRVSLETEEGVVTALLASASARRLGLNVGTAVTALIPMNAIMLAAT